MGPQFSVLSHFSKPTHFMPCSEGTFVKLNLFENISGNINFISAKSSNKRLLD